VNNSEIWTQVVYRNENEDQWGDMLDSDDIFWSDDERNFVSSNNIETVIVASDSDNNDSKITVFEIFEDKKNWADNEIDIEFCKDPQIKNKLCWT